MPAAEAIDVKQPSKKDVTKLARAIEQRIPGAVRVRVGEGDAEKTLLFVNNVNAQEIWGKALARIDPDAPIKSDYVGQWFIAPGLVNNKRLTKIDLSDAKYLGRVVEAVREKTGHQFEHDLRATDMSHVDQAVRAAFNPLAR